MAAHVPKQSPLLLFVCVCLCVCAEWNTKDFLRREHTLVKPYQGSGLSVPQWDFIGSTLVTNSHIRLTTDHQSKQGAIWNNIPCTVLSWELHVQFKVHGSGKNLFGDGIAIWYTRERMQSDDVLQLHVTESSNAKLTGEVTSNAACHLSARLNELTEELMNAQAELRQLKQMKDSHLCNKSIFSVLQENIEIKKAQNLELSSMTESLQEKLNECMYGPVFGSKDYFTGLGIFLDTYSNHNGPHNHQHPYVSAMINNGSLHYDHDTDGTHTQIAGCEAQFRNKDYDTFIAIRYENNNLKVSLDVDNKNGWKECFSVNGIRLPVGYYFGASAATGDLADNHDIISLKLYDLDIAGQEGKSETQPYFGLPEAAYMEPHRDRIDDIKGSYLLGSLSGWKLFMIIILIIIGLSVVGVVGFMIFQKKQENSRKRFY